MPSSSRRHNISTSLVSPRRATNRRSRHSSVGDSSGVSPLCSSVRRGLKNRALDAATIDSFLFREYLRNKNTAKLDTVGAFDVAQSWLFELLLAPDTLLSHILKVEQSTPRSPPLCSSSLLLQILVPVGMGTTPDSG